MSAILFGKRCIQPRFLGCINLVVRRVVGQPRQRLSWLAKLPYMFANAADPTVADAIPKSWRSLSTASQHPVTVRNCMLWEGDLQRIANQEALIDEQKVFPPHARSSSSGSEGWHR